MDCSVTIAISTKQRYSVWPARAAGDITQALYAAECSHLLWTMGKAQHMGVKAQPHEGRLVAVDEALKVCSERTSVWAATDIKDLLSVV